MGSRRGWKGAREPSAQPRVFALAADRETGSTLAMGSAMRILLLVLLTLLAVQPTASAEVPLFPEEFERADIIVIERDGQELFGFDSLTGR